MRRYSRLVVCLLITAAACAEAAFFMRLRGSGSRQIEAIGGRPIYRTTARINGTPASLHVFGFGSAAGDVTDELRRLWQLPAPAKQGPAWLTRVRGTRTSHLLILPGVRLGDSTVWLIEPQGGGTLRRGAAIPEPPAVNPYPAGELHNWIVNDQTRSLFILYRTPEAPAAALARVTSALSADGWQAQTSSDALAMLARDGRAALACATTCAATGRTQLSVFLQGAAARP
jgi:hypothetical protein